MKKLTIKDYMVGFLVAVILIMSLSVMGIDNKFLNDYLNKIKSYVNISSETNKIRNIVFNKNSKDTETNGNIEIALNMFEQIYSGKEVTGVESDIKYITDASYITKKPYSHLGKFLNVKGKIYKIEELPRKVTTGKLHWTSILLEIEDKNDAFGLTTADFWCLSDVDSFYNDDIVKITAVFTGTYSSSNLLGGSVEALHFVGATIEKLPKH